MKERLPVLNEWRFFCASVKWIWIHYRQFVKKLKFDIATYLRINKFYLL